MAKLDDVIDNYLVASFQSLKDHPGAYTYNMVEGALERF